MGRNPTPGSVWTNSGAWRILRGPAASTVMRVPRLALAAALTALAAASRPGAPAVHAQTQLVDLPPVVDPEPGLLCVPPDADGRIRKAALSDGAALSFRQDPAWLSARPDQGLRLRRFVVAGDVDRVRFDRWDPEANAYAEETWTREATDTIGGRLVSIFEPSWPASVIQTRLGRVRVGLDDPDVFLGYYKGPADNATLSHAVSARVGFEAIGPTEVVRVDDTVQYASHVVNLVIADFGDRRLVDDYDLRAVTKRFYEFFADDYDVIAVVPADAHVDQYGAYHQTVRNDVQGLGQSIVDRTADYGSSGRLRGVEAFHNTRVNDTFTTSHELSHIWGHTFNWARIAGLTRAGHQPTFHAPLISGGESLVSGVLTPTRRIVVKDDGEAVIERATPPFRPHPLDRYAMGLDAPADLPTFTLFDDQGQFNASTTSEPAPGTAVNGGRRSVSVNDVMAAHGARSGPVLSELRRATVVVSRDGLLPPDQIAMWNFFASRQEDAGGSGVVGYTGQGSFDASTDRRIDLVTGIRPRDAAPLARTQNPEPAAFGARDCGGVTFTTAPPTRVRAGQRFTIAGRITATDRSDFTRVLFRFWPSDGAAEKVERAFADASRSGDFRVDVEIRSGREGQYSLDGFLFWEGAPSQWPRCSLSVVNVTP